MISKYDFYMASQVDATGKEMHFEVTCGQFP